MVNEDILKNDRESIRFRRHSNNLVVLGTGVILFGFWGIIKIAMNFIFGIELFTEADIEQLGENGMVITLIILIIIMAVDVLLRLHTGLRARKEGAGGKVSASYVVISVFLIIGSVLSVAIVIESIFSLEEDAIDSFLSFFMELTSLALTIELFISAISVRKYKKKLERGK